MTVIAIHQPNFFPWLGYFDKVIRSDIFVFLDHVQYQKTGGVWSNRVKVLIGNEARWVTAPISRNFRGVRRIDEIFFVEHSRWRAKILQSLVTNYSKATYFREAMAIIEPLILNQENNLARYNAEAIISIAKLFGQSQEKFRWSSTMRLESHSNEMLIAITKENGGDVYMCGGGAQGYQIDSTFREASVDLAYQNFQHPEYTQKGIPVFVPGLSVIDLLMQIGPHRARTVLVS